VGGLLVTARLPGSSSKYKLPSACPLASRTTKDSAFSSIDQGGGKRRLRAYNNSGVLCPKTPYDGPASAVAIGVWLGRVGAA